MFKKITWKKLTKRQKTSTPKIFTCLFQSETHIDENLWQNTTASIDIAWKTSNDATYYATI